MKKSSIALMVLGSFVALGACSSTTATPDGGSSDAASTATATSTTTATGTATSTGTTPSPLDAAPPPKDASTNPDAASDASSDGATLDAMVDGGPGTYDGGVCGGVRFVSAGTAAGACSVTEAVSAAIKAMTCDGTTCVCTAGGTQTSTFQQSTVSPAFCADAALAIYVAGKYCNVCK